ncbi:hypothetical protein KCP74_21370 [Salmonella enterica subsp. enterica]|nr:hypothetical protein KCP74_21370 [Salmonella enterica subsp. enterica]
MGWYGASWVVTPGDKVVRLHSTEWSEQQFHRAIWTRALASLGGEMSNVATQRALREQWARIGERTGETNETAVNVQGLERNSPDVCRLTAPVSHVWRFAHMREIWRKVSGGMVTQDSEEGSRQQHNQAYADAILGSAVPTFTLNDPLRLILPGRGRWSNSESSRYWYWRARKR